MGQASAGTSSFRQILGNARRHKAERQYDSGAMNKEAHQHQHGSQSQTSHLKDLHTVQLPGVDLLEQGIQRAAGRQLSRGRHHTDRQTKARTQLRISLTVELGRRLRRRQEEEHFRPPKQKLLDHLRSPVPGGTLEPGAPRRRTPSGVRRATGTRDNQLRRALIGMKTYDEHD